MNAAPAPALLTWVSSTVQVNVDAIIQVGSNEANEVFRLTCGDRNLFLKIGPNLLREYHRLQWLSGRLPAPRPLGFTTDQDADALLTAALAGESLAGLSASLPAQIIVTRLVTALKVIHAADIADWPYDRIENGTTLVHGDACLPNFIYHSDRLSGYIDVGDMRVDRPEVDLAAAIWSLQYNLGSGHGLTFLREYGVPDATENEVERLRLMYEQG